MFDPHTHWMCQHEKVAGQRPKRSKKWHIPNHMGAEHTSQPSWAQLPVCSSCSFSPSLATLVERRHAATLPASAARGEQGRTLICLAGVTLCTPVHRTGASDGKRTDLVFQARSAQPNQQISKRISLLELQIRPSDHSKSYLHHSKNKQKQKSSYQLL